MKHPLKEIALFIVIVPAFSVWVPLILCLIMAITQAEIGLVSLVYWFFPGIGIMRIFGYSDQDLTSGGDFMRLPSDLAVTGVFAIYTLIGLVSWLFVFFTRFYSSPTVMRPKPPNLNLPPSDW